MKKNVVFNADDFGFSEAVNYGILRAHKQGVVTSTSLMANMPGYDHAIQVLQETPTLHVGVHLNITCGKPVLNTQKTMTNEAGYFVHGQEDHYDEEEIFQELCAQIEKVKSSGVAIDHLDSHHHIHTEVRFQHVITRILDIYPYPIRGGFLYKNTYPKQSDLCIEFYDKGVSLKNLQQLLQNFEAGKLIDVMCHPAYLDDILIDFSSYRMQRIEELRILCDPQLKTILASTNTTLVNYQAIK